MNSFSTNTTTDVKMVQLGSVKITLAAFVTLVAGLVLAVALFFVGSFGPILSVYVLLVFMLLSYNVNCAQLGHCKVWAWFLTIVYVFYALVIVFATFTKKDLLVKALSEKMKKRGGRR